MKTSYPLLLMLTFAVIFSPGCKPNTPLPDQAVASKLIQDLIIENGNMDGGNMIEIHRFNIKNIEATNMPNTARVQFEIDFTRHPTSGLSPEHQQEEPTRQTEQHQATLKSDKKKWTVEELSLH